MKSRHIAREVLATTLAIAVLMSCSALWARPSGFAATNPSVTRLTDQPATPRVANGKIAFVHTAIQADGKGSSAIYKMNADGGERMRLTSGPTDFSPVWSPDGTQIAFVRYSDYSGPSQRGEILVMNADGSNQRSLTPPGECDYAPAWSPDGAQLVFTRDEGEPRVLQIFTVNADGSNQRRLTYTADNNDSPSWSPDGTKIAWENRFGLVVMNADGSDQKMIGRIHSFAWSPDSSKLVATNYEQVG